MGTRGLWTGEEGGKAVARLCGVPRQVGDLLEEGMGHAKQKPRGPLENNVFMGSNSQGFRSEQTLGTLGLQGFEL